MPSPLLQIINMPHVSELQALMDSPRALQPVAYSNWPCMNCNARCCKDDSVPVTTVEAIRIAFAALIPLERVVQQVERAGTVRETLAAVPIPLKDGLVTLRLRHSDAGDCVFLYNAAGTERCSIHPNRPGKDVRPDEFDALWDKLVELMRIGVRDILGLADFEQNLTELSALADACLCYGLPVSYTHLTLPTNREV